METKVLHNNSIKIGNLEIGSILAAAPLAGITDTVQRQIIRKFSKNCLITTEMLSSEALVNNPRGAILESSPSESPLAFQLVGHKPDIMLKAAKIIEARADIIDINMGCPVNKVFKGNDGSALMKTPELAADIVKTLKDNINKPITVKCRLGINNENKNFIEFAQLMQTAGADAITLHARTRSQMYSGKADWGAIRDLKANIDIPVFANGDIISTESAIECLNITHADGLAIGRGMIGNPFLFKEIEHYISTGEKLEPPTLKEKIDILTEHLNQEIALRGELNGIKFFRKFYSYYIFGIKNAAICRGRLVREENYDNIISILEEILNGAEDVHI